MEKPILFNTEMVKAILEGRKTQTRRIVKGLEHLNVYRAEPSEEAYDTCAEWDFFYGGRLADGGMYDAIESIKAPCAIGDMLWVRETWRPAKGVMHTYINGEVVESSDWHDGFEYRTGGYSFPDGFEESNDMYHLSEIRSAGNWHPSIHMPREAARLFLKVKDVRIEHLKDITDEQALEEGMPDDGDYPINPIYCQKCKGEGTHDAVHPESLGHMEVDCEECNTPTKRFAHLWNSTLKPVEIDRFGWAANPWIWVIEFEKCEKPKGWCGA